jgi:hypothetical protein
MMQARSLQARPSGSRLRRFLLVVVMAVANAGAQAAESPCGGPIKPPAPEKEVSRELVAPPPACVVEAQACAVPAGTASGSACACEIDGVAKAGIVKRVRRPEQAK